MITELKSRLSSFGYELKADDESVLKFAFEKVENTIKNECNVNEIPQGLKNIAIDMAAGEFLKMKKTFAPQDITALDLNLAVKQIQIGDISTVFAVGDGSMTAEERLDNFINYLLIYGRSEFVCYRQMRW